MDLLIPLQDNVYSIHTLLHSLSWGAWKGIDLLLVHDFIKMISYSAPIELKYPLDSCTEIPKGEFTEHPSLIDHWVKEKTPVTTGVFSCCSNHLIILQ